jgi:hypothetical protein
MKQAQLSPPSRDAPSPGVRPRSIAVQGLLTDRGGTYRSVPFHIPALGQGVSQCFTKAQTPRLMARPSAQCAPYPRWERVAVLSYIYGASENPNAPLGVFE